jgi:glutathione synthase/RimK-type ligase-like ATP-grasp enzyme
VCKVANRAELRAVSAKLFKDSELLLAQEFTPTEFDWRIGILNRKPLYVCQYGMAEGHWQIVDHTGSKPKEGTAKTISVEEAPKKVVQTALRAANLIGDGLYGVDLKETANGVLVIEVNDNPNIDGGVEDAVLGPGLYQTIMAEFVRRMEAKRTTGWPA